MKKMNDQKYSTDMIIVNGWDAHVELATNADIIPKIRVSHWIEIERAARHLLFEIDKVPYRLTAQTFGPEAAEVGAALDELRTALNGERDVNRL